MARLVRKEDKGPVEIKIGETSRWVCMCSVMARIKRQQMKKLVRFTDIVLMDLERRSDNNNFY
jgi:hypothetical protein